LNFGEITDIIEEEKKILSIKIQTKIVDEYQIPCGIK